MIAIPLVNGENKYDTLPWESGLTGPERTLPGRYSVRPSLKREGDLKHSNFKKRERGIEGQNAAPRLRVGIPFSLCNPN